MYFLCIGALLVLAGFSFNKIKGLDLFFSVLLGIYLISLTYLASNIADNVEYASLYNSVNTNPEFVSSVTSNNWVRLCQWGIANNLSYQQFKTILFSCGLLIILFLINKWVGSNFSYLLSLYLVFPALVDIIQIRFFVALTICMIGLFFLEKNKKWSTLLYVVLVFWGATIHNTVVFFLIFLIIPLIKKQKFGSLITIGILDIFFLLFGRNFLSILGNWVSVKQAQYINDRLPILSSILMICIMIILSIICNLINKQIMINNKVTEKYKSIAEFVNNANICMLLLIAILPLSFNMFRLERISWFLFYILMGIMLKYNISIVIKKVRIDIKFLTLITCIITFCVLILHFEPAAFWSLISSENLLNNIEGIKNGKCKY